ncbi:hypothetical protein Pth03_23470 [Planotetraspora thailandica]|uniref:non-specific serine/threonine protein kinase n=1 Tax=Planotetraspora thailandica TaxID=487172 RepID=A0A8J3XY77_9ACTN|nr:serine/threonine-protein kinase [Planotetraspora thailandica]GII53958.1 hypothetical protein Pth03_23470 [Planotetraspora thailandica]
MNDGRRIAGRYHLLEPIGRGGMGVVWRAHDEVLDRTVAVKEVIYRTAGDEEREAFNRRTVREARAAGRIAHPAVVVVHDVIEEDGRPWIVMQLVQARSLGDVLREEGPLPPGRVASVGLQVLDALRTAHAEGVLHRDVKPENVLLQRGDRAVLTDFGIATMPEETTLTMTGMVTGTPAFLAPERLTGQPAAPESDLWSLGATMYAAVEGRPPFERDSAIATMAAVIHTELEPPRRAGALGPVIEGLLVKDPARRMTAATAASRLEAVTHPSPLRQTAPATGQHEGSGESPVPPRAIGSRDHRRRDAPGAAPSRGASRTKVALLVLLPIVLATGGWYGYSRLAAPATVVTATTGDATPGTAAPAPATSATGGPASTKPAPSSSSPGAVASGLPAGWTTYTDGLLGFSIALPPGWTAFDREKTRVRFHGPGVPGYLQVDFTAWTADDPVTALTGVETASKGRGLLPGYQRIRLSPVDWRGSRAAEWEFSFTPSYGKVRVLDRAFRSPAGRDAALYWQTTESKWTGSMSYFRVLLTTFLPK